MIRTVPAGRWPDPSARPLSSPGRTGELQGPRAGIDQGHPEEQDGRREGREDQVLDPGLDAERVDPQVGDQRVQGDAEHLEPQEERGKVAGRRENHRTQQGRQQEHVVFLPALLVPLQIVVGQQQHEKAGQEDEPHEEKGVRVDDQERRHLPGRQRGGRPYGDAIAAMTAPATAANVRMWLRLTAMTSMIATGAADRMSRGGEPWRHRAFMGASGLRQ